MSLYSVFCSFQPKLAFMFFYFSFHCSFLIYFVRGLFLVFNLVLFRFCFSAMFFLLLLGFVWYWHNLTLVSVTIWFFRCLLIMYYYFLSTCLNLVFCLGPGKSLFFSYIICHCFAWAPQNHYSYCKCEWW
jgi:hypothetical protein